MLRRHRKWWWKYPPPTPNTLTLKKLDASSQSGRVQYPGQTRGQKADRLQLVAKIAPVADAATSTWSATGLFVQDGKVYVSWHSNRQATAVGTPASAWGGALDVISLPVSEENPVFTIEQTLSGNEFKLNNVVAAGSNLYFPITSYNKGAVVGRVSLPFGDTVAMDTISVPGVSANAIAVDGSNLRVVTGYKGGVFTVPAAFSADNRTITENIAYSEDFGGKYIVGDRVLRSNDQGMQVVSLTGSRLLSGAPLVSAEKQAESYNPDAENEADKWVTVEGTEATHYGKHTMAIEGNYTYVGGGKGADGKNGLRVYAATGLVWENGTNTTAVTVDGDYVYAATGAGLRVYEKFNSATGELPLYAYEVLNYDENGKAADGVPAGYPNAADYPDNKPVAGTDAHSSNFVAVGGGYIFVACGQSGVYVFKLDTSVPAKKVEVSLSIPENNGDKIVKDEIDEDSEGTELTVPEGQPEVIPDGKDFEGWSENPEDPDAPVYKPGDKVPVTPGNPTVELKPVYKNHEYKYTLVFNGNHGSVEVSNLPSTIKSDEAIITIPANVKPTVPAGTINPEFIGWALDPATEYTWIEAGYWTPLTQVEFTETGTITVYAVWANDAFAGGDAGGGGNNGGDNNGGNNNGGDNNGGSVAGGSDSGNGSM